MPMDFTRASLAVIASAALLVTSAGSAAAASTGWAAGRDTLTVCLHTPAKGWWDQQITVAGGATGAADLGTATVDSAGKKISGLTTEVYRGFNIVG